jgi:NitT/TauT family transport system substrate-binding protein
VAAGGAGRGAWLALLVTVGACSAPATSEVLTIGTARQPAFALLFVADAKGFFASEGVRVEQRRFATGRDALDALIRGEVDVATAFDTPVVLRAAQVPDLEVLTTLHVSTRYNRLIARRGSGISSEADLRGRRIAAPRGTSAEYFLHHLLTMGGVPATEVTIADLGPDAAVDALAEGSVDAIASWTPYAERATVRLGPGAVVEIGSDAFTEASMLVTRSAVRGARTEALVRFVRALERAERLVVARPDEAFAVLRGEFPELDPAGLKRAWSHQAAQLGLSALLAQLLARESEWFRSTGRLDAPALDVQRLLAPEILSKVADEAVTFVPGAAPGPPR